MTGYVPDPANSGWCYSCGKYMTGCSACSSTTTCTNCLTGYSGPSGNICSCSGWVVNGYCTTILGCTMVSIINGTQTCTTCNSTKLMELGINFRCPCIFGATLSGSTCVAICGDNYVLPVEGCDDGNTVDGDGCSSTCTVETDWACTGTYAQGSTCKIVNVTQLTYTGTIRDTTSNKATLYYKLSPYYK
jgi:cysteine-rich repeat protein